MPMKSLQRRSPPERPDFSREAPALGIVCGVDEAGRGPLAGPVYAGCVYVPDSARAHPVWAAVRDSKQLSAGRRDDLYGIIQGQSCFGIGHAEVEEIDRLNILQATYLAMQRSIEDMRSRFSLAPPDLVLIDGNRLPPFLPYPGKAVIKGDTLSVSIAAASILAKVSRDRVMQDLHCQYPAYGWNDNSGYGTAAHLEAIARNGITPHHRMSFAPIRQAA